MGANAETDPVDYQLTTIKKNFKNDNKTTDWDGLINYMEMLVDLNRSGYEFLKKNEYSKTTGMTNGWNTIKLVMDMNIAVLDRAKEQKSRGVS